MSEVQSDKREVPITFSSSAGDDGWHDDEGPDSFESWHFDVLSEDGREALIVSFYDNYPYSPRYYEATKIPDGHIKPYSGEKCPAVTLVYSVDGQMVLNAVNEFRTDEFVSKKVGVNCSIGGSWFKTESAEYGKGYIVDVDLMTARNRRIRGELEWLSIEADMLSSPADSGAPAVWNIVSPRSDVTGRINVIGPDGDTLNVFHIRGTGSHDHLRSKGALDEIVSGRCWGRAHFVDSTAFFQCVDLPGEGCASMLYLVKDGVIRSMKAEREVGGYIRSRFGLKLPKEIRFTTDGGVSLHVQPERGLESGFCEVKAVSKVSLFQREEKLHETMGILAVLAPGRLRRRFLRRLSGLRIGVNGRPPLF
jgi:hypothetical protein